MADNRDLKHFVLQLKELGGDLGDIPKDVTRELRPEMRKAAGPILDRARRNAFWSKRIPKATRIQASLSQRSPGVSIITNIKKAPHARAYENKGLPGTFRHPVFGNRRVWVPQKARPFLAPAVPPHENEVVEAVDRVVDMVARKYGFR